MRVRDIAALLGTAFEGEGEREITGVADLAGAGAGHIAFAYGAKAPQHVAASGAGCVIVSRKFPEGAGRTLIRTPDARAAFARVVREFHPEPQPEPGIHPTAAVAPGVELGEGVAVGAYTTIGEGTRIGARTVIGAGCHIGEGVEIGAGGRLHDNVTIYPRVEIGRRVVLHAGAVLGADGFGFVMVGDHYEKFPQVGTVHLGDDVEIGAHSCVDRAALGVTRLGDGVKLDNMVHIAHNVTIGNHVVIVAQTGISGSTVVEDYAVIGGQVGIGDKARIESRAVLGSGCGVLSSKTIRSGQTVWGTPARPLKQYLKQLGELSRLGRLREHVADLAKRLERLEKRV